MDRFGNPETLMEFPIIPGGVFREGGDEGPDRVVFDVMGRFCGILTHRGGEG